MPRPIHLLANKNEMIVNLKASCEDDSNGIENPDISRFLDPPSDEELEQCYRQFYDATSLTLSCNFCAVCAGDITAVQGQVNKVKLSDVPNSYRLQTTKRKARRPRAINR
jgi:hypothetical protein